MNDPENLRVHSDDQKENFIIHLNKKEESSRGQPELTNSMSGGSFFVKFSMNFKSKSGLPSQAPLEIFQSFASRKSRFSSKLFKM